MGEGQPVMRVTEEIRSEGLNNEVAEYLPVKEKGGQHQSSVMNDTITSWRRTPHLRDNYM